MFPRFLMSPPNFPAQYILEPSLPGIFKSPHLLTFFGGEASAMLYNWFKLTLAAALVVRTAEAQLAPATRAVSTFCNTVKQRITSVGQHSSATAFCSSYLHHFPRIPTTTVSTSIKLRLYGALRFLAKLVLFHNKTGTWVPASVSARNVSAGLVVSEIELANLWNNGIATKARTSNTKTKNLGGVCCSHPEVYARRSIPFRMIVKDAPIQVVPKLPLTCSQLKIHGTALALMCCMLLPIPASIFRTGDDLCLKEGRKKLTKPGLISIMSKPNDAAKKLVTSPNTDPEPVFPCSRLEHKHMKLPANVLRCTRNHIGFTLPSPLYPR